MIYTLSHGLAWASMYVSCGTDTAVLIGPDVIELLIVVEVSRAAH